MTDHNTDPNLEDGVAQATENQPDDDLDPDDVDASETEAAADRDGEGRNDPAIDGPADKPAI